MICALGVGDIAGTLYVMKCDPTLRYKSEMENNIALVYL